MSQQIPGADAERELARRVEQLESQVRTLAAAVHALAEGLAPIPLQDEARPEPAQDGARLAHDLLVAAGL